jgi:hypothetical protein
MQKSGGYSRTAKARRRRAASLSQQMRCGDRKAAFRLKQRRRALQGIAKHGYAARVKLMNAARAANRLRCQQDHEAREREILVRTEREVNRQDAVRQQMQRQAARNLEARQAATRPPPTAKADQEARESRERARAQAQARQIARELAHRQAMQKQRF